MPHSDDEGHWMGVDGTYVTLGTRLAAELVEAFTTKDKLIFTGTNVANGISPQPQCQQYYVDVGCCFTNRKGTFSLDVLATPDGAEYTRIIYE